MNQKKAEHVRKQRVATRQKWADIAHEAARL
jgi:hypothetical protein